MVKLADAPDSKSGDRKVMGVRFPPPAPTFARACQVRVSYGFVVLSADHMTIPEDQMRHLRPMATYVGGRKVCSALGAKATF